MTQNRPHPDGAFPAQPRWHLRLLGDVVLTDARGTVHRLPGRTTTALLARLALAPDRAHAREALVDLLWPGVALDVGRNRLRQALSTLQTLLDLHNAPLLATTLIAPGETDPLNDAHEIRERFEHALAAIIDAGACPSEPTTVIDLQGDAPVLVRQGRGDAARVGL